MDTGAKQRAGKDQVVFGIGSLLLSKQSMASDLGRLSAVDALL
jgi:predicted RND superfamily exporter protein